jgi:hypothetical protein
LPDAPVPADPAPAADVLDAGVTADAPVDADGAGADVAADDTAAGDAAADAAGDASGDATGTGAACTFNSDCPSDQRCECDEMTGCFCRPGVRGTGQSGVDPCTDGNDCQTSLCVEGQGGQSYCSGPCQTDADCGAQLPSCADIAGLGRICIRSGP